LSITKSLGEKIILQEARIIANGPMRLLPLPEPLVIGIKKNCAWIRLHGAMLDLDQLRTLVHNGQEKALCREWLHREEQEKLETLHYEKRHLEWLGGRICAKQATLQYLHDMNPVSAKKNSTLSRRTLQATTLRAPLLQIMTTASGRPFLDSNIPANELDLPSISISHSRKYALAVAASTACGIDIQITSDALVRVQDRFCSQKEEELLGRSLMQLQLPDHLTLLWAAKEAVKKGAQLENMPGFLDLSLTHIQPTAKDGFVSRVPGKAQERPTVREVLGSLVPEPKSSYPFACPDQEQPVMKAEGSASYLFTFDYQDHQKKSCNPQLQFQVIVCQYQGYGIGLCAIPPQPQPGTNYA
jgi:phosphopantetheinyl transferase